MDTLPKIVVITGPTASGKSAVACTLARAVGGEIVSADSAAVYRYLDIGTAKPTPKERKLVPHHLIDIVNPDEQFNAMAYRTAADESIRGIIERARVPIVAGGTGLYLKALLLGLFGEGEDPEDKGEIRDELNRKSTELLFEELSRVDPPSAARINRNDRVRILRALEIYLITGVPKSQLAADHGSGARRYDALSFGLVIERSLLYERIDRRVDDMIKKGIVEEAEGILKMGYKPSAPGLSTIGYREIVGHLLGTIDLETAISLIKRKTRNYAKRQMTWFRRMEGIRRIPYPYDTSPIAGEIREFMKRPS